MSYDPLQDIESSETRHAYDPLADIETNTPTAPAPPAAPKAAKKAAAAEPEREPGGFGNPFSDLEDIGASIMSGIVGSIGGGLRALPELKGVFSMPEGERNAQIDKAAAKVREAQDAMSVPARTESGREAAEFLANSPYSPTNWISDVTGAIARPVAHAGFPAAATALDVGGQAAAAWWLGKPGGGARAAAAGEVPGTALRAGDVPIPEPLRVVEQPPRAIPEAPIAASAEPLSAAPAAPRALPGVPAAQPPAALSAAAAPPRTPSTFAEALRQHAEGGLPDTFRPEAETVTPGAELPPDEQARRRRVLAEVGITGDTDFRNSALTGDPLSAGTDGQIARLDSPPGRYVKGMLDNERAAVTNYARDSVRETGGRVGQVGGDTQTDDVARGRTVTGKSGALDALEAHLDDLNKRLYKASDEVSQGKPLPAMPNLEARIKATADFHNFEGGDRLLSGVISKMKNLKMMDADGNVLPSTVRNSEALRQFLNAGDGAYPLRASLRDAIDQDVFSQSGEDIYKPARALFKLRKDTLENPNGINRMMAADGPEGINRKTPFNKVMSSMETMDPDQLTHIMGVLRSMTGDLAGKGQTAISNIQAHFASKAEQVLNAHEVQLNSRGYHDWLADNSERLNTVFQDKPEVLHRLYTASEAAKILRYNPAYPGAAAQAANLSRAGVLPGLVQKGTTLAGEAIGSAMGFPGVGTLIGAGAGTTAAGAITEASAMRAARRRAAPQP